MNSILMRTARALLSAKITSISVKHVIPSVQSHGFKTALLLGTAAIAQSKVDEKSHREAELAFLGDVKDACNKNDQSLKELMHVLSECITEISKEYQNNLKHQIEIINRCTQLGPVGEHWDELTHYRVTANELRQELMKYEILVQKVGQMAYNQAVTSLLSGVENAMDLLEVDYNNLEQTVNKISKDNYQLEAKLLYANRDSILYHLK